jgi:tRNA (cmo5U34)-methyltransferase
MSEFDIKASTWDANPMHLERSKAIAAMLLQRVPVTSSMKAMEFGGGTGLLSLELKEKFSTIVLLDNSMEMVRITNEKIASLGIANMEAHCIDLERENYPGNCDVIYTQMVFHHVNDIGGILEKFHGMLNPGGYLAIADLYPEDGSFHDPSFTGHRGFDTDKLSAQLGEHGFKDIVTERCFVIRKPGEGGSAAEYPVFLMTGRR